MMNDSGIFYVHLGSGEQVLNLGKLQTERKKMALSSTLLPTKSNVTCTSFPTQ
jgi:hypothetical protein